MLNAWSKIKELINKKQNILNITTGIEYETGRIIDGKKEYAKRFNCGNGPNNETIQVETGLTNVKYTKIEGMAYTTSIFFPLNMVRPIGKTDSTSIGVYVSANKILIESAIDRSAFTIVVDVYYLKN